MPPARDNTLARVDERERGPAEAPNLGTPAVPRPAASVVLLRRGGRHSDRLLEVLLLKRAESARFMPGVWVFPGGAVDPGDGDGEAGYRSCAVRELEEEADISLAAEEELVLFSRWITPEVVSRRFDAWFFLALAPAHTPPKPDGVETTEAAWFEPAQALKAQAAGELALAFPTVKQLESLQPFRTSDEAIEAHRDREVEPILPKVVGTPEEHRVVLPDDPDYPA
ncbi:MAG TPA: NUDIX hydrolase [Solirubrobacterales bacterium]|nr:NUDIX hydrolase [Solirubrobacterales bacterium]